MAKAKKAGESSVSIFCPGCKQWHILPVRPAPSPSWKFNGDMDAPTFHPSLLIRSGCHAQHHKKGDPCWCAYNKENPEQPSGFSCGVCHTFIKEGRIEFLSDCTRALAGQSVPLPDIE